MGLLVLVSAAGFACLNPTHHDGDAIRCAGEGRSMRLYGIDAPEMPGACRPGRRCTPGDPFAARDYLQGLTAGRSVMCEQVDTDSYGRRVVDCTADGINLGCAMVASGHAVERYGRLDCDQQVAAAPVPEAPPDQPVEPDGTPADVAAADTGERFYAPAAAPVTGAVPPVGGLALWLLLVNAVAYAAMAIDKSQAVASARRRVWRVPEAMLLGLAVLGGSPGALAAQQRLRHKTRKQPFAALLLAIAGLQLGGVIGWLLWLR
jgi:uncharacterized membrane protein YsdA (DUF1294 family)